MTIGRCKTCKHWEPQDPRYHSSLVGSGVCHKVPQLWDVTDEAPYDYSQKILKPAHAALLAVVEDGSSYMATLITMPDFGCVMHEPAAAVPARDAMDQSIAQQIEGGVYQRRD